MKITKLPAQRQNISIEMTPDEQGILACITGDIVGGGPIRVFTNKLFDELLKLGSDFKKHHIEHSLDTGVE